MKYLIAHKVRGEIALDVAEQLEVRDETWWIIPTSGHRAYPFYFAKLENLVPGWTPDFLSALLPPDLQDHYSVNDMPRSRREPTIRITDNRITGKINKIELDL